MNASKAELKQLVLDRLSKSGFSVDSTLTVEPTKSAYRKVHRLARRHEIALRRGEVRAAWRRHRDAFASGSDINPLEIRPRLRLIPMGDDEGNDLFRLARLYWSLPYSQGYGRRLRFLLWDDASAKLMGIVGLQSPPLDFRIRDSLFDYPEGRKTALVNQMMDAYTVGAVPPFSFLLGGKLAAMALGSDQLRNAYARRYGGVTTEIEHRVLPPRLIAVTTTSAFGKSSLYDRVRGPDGQLILRPLGVLHQTYGSYQFNGVYGALRDYLVAHGKLREYCGYGIGPRIRWQVLRKGLREIGLSDELLMHRVPREVFLVSHLSNLREYVAGEDARPHWVHRPFAELSLFWRTRWLIPRWQRMQADPSSVTDFREWNRKRIIASILNA